MYIEKQNTVKVLITGPSINSNLIIGGISNLTKLLIEKNTDVTYIHFIRGKKDFERRGFWWLFRQPLVLLSF